MNIKKQLAWSVGIGVGLMFLLVIAGLAMTASLDKGEVTTKSIEFLGLTIMRVVSDEKGFEFSTGVGVVVIPLLAGLVTFFGSLAVRGLAKRGPEL